jgi:O-antigen ligase
MQNRILKLSDFVIYWSIVILPFAVAIAPGVANTFIALFIVFFIITKFACKERLSIDHKILLPFVCLLIVSTLSFKNSVSYGASLHGLVKLFKGLFIVIVCGEMVKDSKHIKRIVISICCAVTLLSIDAIWQIIFGYDFIHQVALQSAIGLIRPTASFPNSNVFGIYMAALIPLVLGVTLFYFKGRTKMLMLLISALGIAGLYLTLSRGAGLGLYIAMLFLCISQKKKFLTFALVSIILIYPFIMPKNIKQWARQVNYNPLVILCNQDRISIYNNTINMIKHHPFFGVGVNTFSKNYGKYKLASAEEYYPTPDTIYAHNIYLHMAGEIGLLGLAAFIWFLFEVFSKSVGAYRKINDPYIKIVSISLIACLIAFLVNGITETSLYYPRVSMIFWYLIGVSLSLAKLAKNNG